MERQLMEKPIAVKRKELKEKLIDLANNETLPAILMADIFAQVAEAVAQMAEYQEKKELAEWNAYIAEGTSETENG